MEIRQWLYYAVVNCVLVCCIVGKTISLNKLIEAESDQKEVIHTTTSPKLQEFEPTAERFSLNKGLKPLNRFPKKIKETGTILNVLPLGKKISSLKYRKTFQIKSPLRPKKVKVNLRTRHKRKNQSIKRDIDSNATINQKYIPLLRSLGMLFDNILGPDSGESFEVTKRKKRLRFDLDGDTKVPCKCPQQESNEEFESEEKTITLSEALAAQAPVTTEATTKIADNTPVGNLRSFRRNKNIPVLLPRNTFGAGRDNIRFSEGSHAAHNGSAERYISWDHGDSEHNSAWRQDESGAQSDEGHTDSDSRDNASGVRYRGAGRGREYRNYTEEANEKDAAISKDQKEKLDSTRTDATEYNGEDKLETGGNEAESPKFLRKLVRQGGFVPKDEITDSAESVQSEKNNKESDVSLALVGSGNQRILDGDGAHTTETQKTNATYETVTHKSPDLMSPFVSQLTKTSRTKGPVVVIIDGYSVTRHKNGENKLAKKAIRVRPN